MISPAARPFVVAAYARRLQRLNLPGEPIALPQSDAPEEVLRRLMVGCRPKMLRPGGTAARLEPDAAELLMSLASSAAGEDVRYLDAFNTFFELARPAVSDPAPGPWSRLLPVYAHLLRLQIDRLHDSAHVELVVEPLPVGWSAEDERTVAAWRQAVPPLSIVVLADNARAAGRTYRGLQPFPELAIHVLIANNHGDGWCRSLLRQWTGICRTPCLVPPLLRGRVHLRMAPLHDPDVIQWLRDQNFWAGLHAMGVLYRHPALSAFRVGLLNAHIGMLPAFRGRSVMEWSLLAGRPTGVTVFVMDEGIDTGRYILWREEVEVTPAANVDQAKSRLFSLDGSMYRSAVRRLLFEPGVRLELNDGPGRRYYVMSRLLVGVVHQLLQRQ